MEEAETKLRDLAFEHAIICLIQAHRTEFESMLDRESARFGLRYRSKWLNRFYKGMKSS